MSIYTCTTVDSVLFAGVGATLAGEISRIHPEINHVPSAYVNVVFQSGPAQFAVVGGQVLPEPGEQQAWIEAGETRVRG